MTKAKRKPSVNFYRAVCRTLGVTEAGLKVLLRIKSGAQSGGGHAGERLERQGFLTAGGWYQPTVYTPRQLTPAGLAVCEKARKLGY